MMPQKCRAELEMMQQGRGVSFQIVERYPEGQLRTGGKGGQCREGINVLGDSFGAVECGVGYSHSQLRILEMTRS